MIQFDDLSTPQNPSAQTVDGGNLSPNTTYYYKIIAVDSYTNDTYGTRSVYQWLNPYRSLPSAEVNAITTDTKKTIDLTWNSIAGATQYKVFRGTTPGTYTYCLKVKITTNSYSDDGSVSTSGLYDMQPHMADGLMHGRVIVTDGTSESPISFNDIYDDAVSNSYTDVVKQQGRAFYFNTNLYVGNASTPTYLRHYRGEIEHEADCFVGVNNLATLQLGLKTANNNAYDGIKWYFRNNEVYSCSRGRNPEIRTSGCLKLYDVAIYIKRGMLYDYGSTSEWIGITRRVLDEMVTHNVGAIHKDIISIKSGYGVQFRTAFPSSVTGYIIKEAFGYALMFEYLGGILTDVIFENCEKDAWFYAGYSSGVTYDLDLIDCSEIDINKVRVDLGPYTRYNVNIKKRIDLLITDKDGIPLQNKNVILKDRDENEVFSLYTDQYGKISTQIVLTKIRSWYCNSDTRCIQTAQNEFTETLKSPFNLKIPKSDYEEYDEIFDLLEPINWTIALQQKFIVESIHSKASKSAYKEDEIAEFSGGVTLSNDLSGVSVLMGIRKVSDDSIIATLLDTTYNFLTDVEVSYETLNGGTNPTWNVGQNTGEFYFKITLSHTDLEGDKEDREYFIVPPPDIVVETKGFGHVVPAEKGGTTSPGRRCGYIKPEG